MPSHDTPSYLSETHNYSLYSFFIIPLGRKTARTYTLSDLNNLFQNQRPPQRTGSLATQSPVGVTVLPSIMSITVRSGARVR
jgi:hypothetical protein